MTKHFPDVDIDFKDRNQALEGLPCIPASMLQNGELKQHLVGVYFQPIPKDPISGLASIPFKEANNRGYFKVDFLNLHIYKDVRDEEHLNELISREPCWELLESEEIVENLFQLGNSAELTAAYAPKSVEELAMVIAVIRPGKRHLIGLPFDELKKDIWQVDPDVSSDYMFKKAHSISYAMAVVIQLNLLVEKLLAEPTESEIHQQNIPEEDQLDASSSD